MPFKLRSVIRGHESDVRAVCPAIHPEGGILTASRDQTCRLWVQSEETNQFIEGHIFSGHTRYISAVTTIGASEQHPQGLVATGGHDNLILVFSLASLDPIYKLEGHTGAISSLASGKFGTLLSGSWDKTANIWVNGQCVMKLSGHSAAIWAVDMMPELGLMITGSADKTIKLWKAGKLHKTLTGHTDCVRGLAVIAAFEFLSCSNDCDIRRWSTSGDCLQIYSGHTNYIYSITALTIEEASFVTCGEDRTVRIWRDGTCEQTIVMPCTSVWSVGCLKNGDIIVGSSDGVTRVFTSVEERFAPADVLKEFEDEVANQAIPAASNLDLGEIKKDELPGPEALLTPGVRDGQTKLVKQGGIVEAYQWDLTQQRWQKVGEVVGAAGTEGSSRSANKKMYNGQEYDYVFDVDIQEGMPPLKLPFNVTDDPWMAAHKFLEENELSPMFLDQVANFITKNTEGVTLGQPQSNFSDPFTGGSRYVPGSSVPSSDPQLNAFQDPFTGGSRYVPGSKSAHSQTTTNNTHDSLTGETRASSNTKESKSTTKSAYFPKTGFLLFESGKPSAVIGKLTEFNSETIEDIQLSEKELNTLSDTLNKICTNKNTNGLDCDTLQQIVDKLLRWPTDKIFPGLDSIRLLLLLEDISKKLFFDGIGAFVDSILRISRPDHPKVNSVLAQRIFCNCFKSPGNAKSLVHSMDKIVEHAVASFLSANKNWQVASASTFLNYTIAATTYEDRTQLLQVISEILTSIDDTESQFRLLVALGTLICKDSQLLSASTKHKSILEKLQNVRDPPKVGECATQLLELI